MSIPPALETIYHRLLPAVLATHASCCFLFSSLLRRPYLQNARRHHTASKHTSELSLYFIIYHFCPVMFYIIMTIEIGGQAVLTEALGFWRHKTVGKMESSIFTAIFFLRETGRHHTNGESVPSIIGKKTQSSCLLCFLYHRRGGRMGGCQGASEDTLRNRTRRRV